MLTVLKYTDIAFTEATVTFIFTN